MAQRHPGGAQRPALFQEQRLRMVGVAVPEFAGHRAATFAPASPIALCPQAASMSSPSAYLRHEPPPLAHSPTGIPSSGPVFPPPCSIIAANGSQQLSHRYSPPSASPSWVTPPNSPPLFPFPPPIAPPPLRHETLSSHPLQPLSPHMHPYHQTHGMPHTVFAAVPPQPTAYFVPPQGHHIHMAVPPQQPHPQPRPQRLSHSIHPWQRLSHSIHQYHHHHHHRHPHHTQHHYNVHDSMPRVMFRQYSSWPYPPAEQPTQHLTITHPPPPPPQLMQIDPPSAEQAPPPHTVQQTRVQQTGEPGDVELPLQMPYVMLPGPSGSDDGTQGTSREDPVDEAAAMVDIESIGGEEEVVTIAPLELGPEVSQEWEECREFASMFQAHREKLGYSRDSVSQQIGIRYGIAVTPASIAQFEQMQLSREDAKSLKKTLEAWMNHTARAAGTSAEEGVVTLATVCSPKERKRRTMIDVLTREQLEAEFTKNQKPSQAELGQIASQLGIGKDFVRIWFCNRRQRQKKRETRGARSSDDQTSVPTTTITVPSSSHDITMEVPLRVTRSRRAPPAVYIVEESEDESVSVPAPSSK